MAMNLNDVARGNEMIQNYMWYLNNCTAFSGHDEWAVERIITASVEAKAKLWDVLKKHPAAIADKYMIILERELMKPVDRDTCYNCQYVFQDWLIYDRADGEAIYRNEYYDVLSPLMCVYTSTLDAAEVVRLNARMEEMETLKSLRFGVGMKRSKAVMKVLTALGMKEKYKERTMTVRRALRECQTTVWDNYTSKYGDAINTQTKKYKVVISVHPIDFIRQSNGTNWASCHNPSKEYADGCNCSGGISYGLDDVTIEMYTLPADFDGDDYEMQDKCERAFIYMAHDLQHFISGPVYSSKRKDRNEEFVTIFREVWSDCIGEDNDWTYDPRYEDYPYDFCYRKDGATCYEDFTCHGIGCQLSYLTARGNDNMTGYGNRIAIGAQPIGTATGERHNIDNDITGYGGHYCYNCDREIYEEDEVYSRYHDAYGCTSCMIYSDYDDDWYYEDEVAYVDSFGGYVSEPSLNHSGDFEQCEHCGEWIYTGGYSDGYEYINGLGWLCEDCMNAAESNGEISRCEDCGEWYEVDDMVEFDGDLYCTNCVVTCDDCGCVIPRSEAHVFYDEHRRYYRCDDCNAEYERNKAENEENDMELAS